MNTHLTRPSVIVEFLVILAIIAGISTYVSRSQGRLPETLVLSIFSVLLLFIMLFENVVISNTKAFIPYTLIIVLLFHSFITTLDLGVMIRIVPYAYVSFLLLFILPNYINLHRFLLYFSVVTTIIILVSMPSVLAIDEVFVIELTVRSPRRIIPGIPPLHPLAGILTNQNYIGYISSITGIWAFYNLHKNRIWIGIALITMIGTILTGSRASLGALLFGIGIIYLSTKTNYLWRVSGYMGLIFTPILILMINGILPTIEIIQSIDMDIRWIIWKEAAYVISKQPFFGYGPGRATDILMSSLPDHLPELIGFHNSYLRVFGWGGMFSGIAYILIHIFALIHSKHVGEFSVIASIVFLQLFQSHTIFGLEGKSMIAAILIGFSLSRK